MADSSSLDRSSSYCTIEHGGRKKGQLYGSTSTATPTQTEEVSALSVSSVVSGKLKRSYKSYLEPSSSTSSSTSTSSNSSSTSPLAAVPRSSKHRWMASKNDEQEHENGANVSVLLLVKNVSLKRSPITTYHISFSLTLASLIQLFMYFYWRSTVNLLLCEISSLY